MTTVLNRLAVFATVLVLAGCGGKATHSDKKAVKPGTSQNQPATKSPPGPPIFTDTTKAAGIDFIHCNGMSGELYFPELMGAGGALFDFDNDGDLDIYLVQGAMLGGKKPSEATFPPQGPLRDRLYRNDLVVHEDGRRELKFTDVTEQSQLDSRGCGMGVAAADYNNDGWVDLYVTNWGSNELWKNNGDNTFSNVTKTAGVDVPAWSTSAAFVDINRDGLLDLFVCNYVSFTYKTHKPCYHQSGARVYCGPRSDAAVPDRLFLNKGNGTFEDVTGPSQIAREYGAGLGVVCCDLNKDGWMDIYVANDAYANQYWINQRNGTFKNEAVISGCAYNRNGDAEGSMGVDAGDYDNDGDEDLFMTHIDVETNTIYINDGRGSFDDETARSGLGLPSRGLTAFGTGFFDYDNDGRLDLFIANGAVNFVTIEDRSKDPYPLRQRNQLFHNIGKGRFEEASSHGGEAFQIAEVGRGAAFGDIDNDGDTDILVTNNSGPARLLRNDLGSQKHWIGLRVTDGRRDMLGASVDVTLADGKVFRRRVRADASYCSANDSRVLIGLGAATAIKSVRVVWPSGASETWGPQAIDQYTHLKQGSGTPETNKSGP